VFCRWTRVGRRIDRWLLGGLVGRRYQLMHLRRTGVAVIDQAAAACLLIHRATVERIGGLFDERFPIFFNDVDLSRRVRDAGLEVHVRYDLSVTHRGGASIRQVSHGERKVWLYEAGSRYYEIHEPAWEARLVRLMVSCNLRRAALAAPR